MLRILICLLFFLPSWTFAADKPITPLIPPEAMRELQNRNAKTVSPDVSSQPGAIPGSPGASADDAALPMQDIHDIRPPEAAGFDPVILYYVLGGLLLIALIAGLIYRFLHRKKRVRTKTTPSLPPHEAALLALEELSDVENMEGKLFYFRLSAIVRHYLEGRFGINAPEMTTEELIPCIDRLEMNRELQSPLKKLFHSADPVKFAGAHAVAKSMQEHLFFARKLVKDTAESVSGAE